MSDDRTPSSRTPAPLMNSAEYQAHTRLMFKEFGELQDFLEKLLGKQFRTGILRAFATLLLLWQQQFEGILQGPKQRETFEKIGEFFFALLNPVRSDKLQREIEQLPGGQQFRDLMIRTAQWFDVTLRVGITHLNPRQQEEVKILAHYILVLVHPGADALRRQYTQVGIHTLEVTALKQTYPGLPILLNAFQEGDSSGGLYNTVLALAALSPGDAPAGPAIEPSGLEPPQTVEIGPIQARHRVPVGPTTAKVLPADGLVTPLASSTPPPAQPPRAVHGQDWASRFTGALRDPEEALEHEVAPTRIETPVIKPNMGKDGDK